MPSGVVYLFTAMYFKKETEMNSKQANLSSINTVYENPVAEIVALSTVDIVSTSGGPYDNNQGEWDPQSYLHYPNY